jgi:hypothetical protein
MNIKSVLPCGSQNNELSISFKGSLSRDFIDHGFSLDLSWDHGALIL